MIPITVLLLVGIVIPQVSSRPETFPNGDQFYSHPDIISHPYFPVWNSFKTKHAKVYRTAGEELKRFRTFSLNYQKIEQHNEEFKNGEQTYQLGMNKFGDMTNEEFRSYMNGLRKRENRKLKSNPRLFEIPDNETIPDSIDWRKEGYVTDVKDQGMCGSCWAFSATGSLEGQHFKKNGKLVSLSEQNLVDCDRDEDEGCNGGYMDAAFEYIEKNKGIDTEESYPYEAQNGKCRFKKENIGATDIGFVDIPEGDEKALTAAIATIGPISVAIDASSFGFQFYMQGVYYNKYCSSEYLDHGVLAVGYGVTKDDKKYYIVKNSWGDDWGDKGYIKMSRDRKNNCGIATMSSYPEV